MACARTLQGSSGAHGVRCKGQHQCHDHTHHLMRAPRTHLNARPPAIQTGTAIMRVQCIFSESPHQACQLARMVPCAEDRREAVGRGHAAAAAATFLDRPTKDADPQQKRAIATAVQPTMGKGSMSRGEGAHSLGLRSGTRP